MEKDKKLSGMHAMSPPSPCIGLCRLNESDVCVGCKRTIDEIIRWSGMTAEAQWQVVESLPGRDCPGQHSSGHDR